MCASTCWGRRTQIANGSAGEGTRHVSTCLKGKGNKEGRGRIRYNTWWGRHTQNARKGGVKVS